MGANTSKFSSLILTFFFTEKAVCLLITYKYQITKITHCITKSIKGPNGVLRTTTSLGLEKPVVKLLIWMQVATAAISCVRWLCTKAQRKHTEKLPARYNKLPYASLEQEMAFQSTCAAWEKKYLWSRFQTFRVTGKTTVKTQVSLFW